VETGSYPIQIAYAVGIFLIALWAWRDVSQNPWLFRFFASISCSLYLIHLPFGTAISVVCYPIIGLGGAIALSFAITVLLGYMSFRFVEAPARKMARWLVPAMRRRDQVAGQRHVNERDAFG
jgi:peptidoglycan/LPS O-acetylase OafA/YrhL